VKIESLLIGRAAGGEDVARNACFAELERSGYSYLLSRGKEMMADSLLVLANGPALECLRRDNHGAEVSCGQVLEADFRLSLGERAVKRDRVQRLRAQELESDSGSHQRFKLP